VSRDVTGEADGTNLRVDSRDEVMHEYWMSDLWFSMRRWLLGEKGWQQMRSGCCESVKHYKHVDKYRWPKQHISDCCRVEVTKNTVNPSSTCYELWNSANSFWYCINHQFMKHQEIKQKNQFHKIANHFHTQLWQYIQKKTGRKWFCSLTVAF